MKEGVKRVRIVHRSKSESERNRNLLFRISSLGRERVGDMGLRSENESERNKKLGF